MTTERPEPEWIRQTRERNERLVAQTGGAMAVTADARPKKSRQTPERHLVEPAFDFAKMVATWTIPLYVVAGDNARGIGKRIGRAGHEREVVGFALARHLIYLNRYAQAIQQGEPVKVTLTKLGGGTVDRWDGLPSSFKYVLDTVCLFMGVRDSCPLLTVEHLQLPGKRVHGVQVRLEKARP